MRAGFLLGMLLKMDCILKITGLHLETKPHIVSLHRRSQKKNKIQQLWSTNSDEVHQIMVVCYQQKTIKPTWRVGDFLLAPSCVSWSIFSYSSLKLNQQSKTPPKRYYCIVKKRDDSAWFINCIYCSGPMVLGLIYIQTCFWILKDNVNLYLWDFFGI